MARTIAAVVSHALGSGGVAYRHPSGAEQIAKVDTVPFGCFRRSLWEALGGFDEGLLGNQDYDFYQLRWSRPGRAETQRVVRGEGASGSWWALNNAWSDTPYTFKVQACYDELFGSDCTPWKVVTYFKDDPSVWH